MSLAIHPREVYEHYQTGELHVVIEADKKTVTHRPKDEYDAEPTVSNIFGPGGFLQVVARGKTRFTMVDCVP